MRPDIVIGNSTNTFARKMFYLLMLDGVEICVENQVTGELKEVNWDQATAALQLKSFHILFPATIAAKPTLWWSILETRW